VLETETFRVIDWLADRGKALTSISKVRAMSADTETTLAGNGHLRKGDVAAIALSAAGKVRDVFLLQELVFDSDDKKVNEKNKERLESNIAGAILVVDARIAGLSDRGLLDHKAENTPRTADDGDAWLAPVNDAPVIRFRVRLVDAEQPPATDSQWRQRYRVATESSESSDGESGRWLIVEKWRHDAATEDDRSEGHPQLLADHQRWAEGRARDLARRLGLPDDYTNMLAIAARLHDEGKRAKRWQRAFNAQIDGVYAKTPGPINYELLDGYRHEFGSLPVVEKDPEFRRLPADLQDLALHLIAAHHGFARPVIAVNGCEDAPPSALEGRARDVAMRFSRLQRRWGPWGLAWWEALLRAADQQASRKNDAIGSTVVKEDA
jgi:CRISPR-associated endonuclease/helicase Cas3